MLKTAPGWELAVDRGPGWLLVKVRSPGKVLPDAPPLVDLLWSVLEQHFTYRLVLELDEIQVVDNYLISQLVELHDRICKHDGVMRVCGLTPYNRRVLLAHRLNDRFVPYVDREDAVLGSCRPRQPR